MRGCQSTFGRHGTGTLFAVLEVATASVHTRTTTQKPRVEFLEFMDQVVADLPPDRDIHVILDNLKHSQVQRSLARVASECDLPLYADLGQLAEYGGSLVWHLHALRIARC